MRLPGDSALKDKEELPTYKNYLINLTKRLLDTRQIAYDNTIKAKINSKIYYDQKLNDIRFNVGDKVSLLYEKKVNKLTFPYTGPYQIIRNLGKNNFSIMSLSDNSIQDVNAERLKPYIEPSPSEQH